jgi:hypothetical protein
MEYVYFVITIAAGSLILVLVWRIGISGWKDGSSNLARQPKSSLKAKSIPPLKKTISGISIKELEQIHFQDRIDVWQKDHEVRRTRLNQPAVPLSGSKYIYTPPEKRRVAATGG